VSRIHQTNKAAHWTLLRLDPGECGPFDVWSGITPYGADLHEASIALALELRRLLMKESKK
jgi:hypothetical protein